MRKLLVAEESVTGLKIVHPHLRSPLTARKCTGHTRAPYFTPTVSAPGHPTVINQSSTSTPPALADVHLRLSDLYLRKRKQKYFKGTHVPPHSPEVSLHQLRKRKKVFLGHTCPSAFTRTVPPPAWHTAYHPRCPPQPPQS